MVVAGMAAHTDISKAHEIANEVRRINKQLKEAQTLASTYNNRERLFGLPVTNVRIQHLIREAIYRNYQCVLFPDLYNDSIVCDHTCLVISC